MKRFYITTPIYYVNAQPHIGHTYTTIAADVLARYFRLKLGPENVYFLTGTDEHGSKIYQKAQEAGKGTQEFCDEVAGQFKHAWEKYNISHNKFIRTTDSEHKAFVQEFVNKIKDAGDFYEDEYEGLYCVGCEKFMTEKELVDGKCPHHLREPELVKEKNWFFDLNKYLPQIKELIENDTIKIMPEHSKKEVLGLIKQGVPNFSVSRNKEKVQWGIELPWDSSQLIYVWCDALTNYLSTQGPKDFWPAQVQLLAKDILKFHALFWPALLMSAGYPVPEKLFIHGFFTVNGQKMSKSLGNVIDPVDMYEEFGADAAKYLLLNQFPFGQDGDIQKDRFVEKYNADLSNGLGNLCNRVITLVEKNYEGVILMSDNAGEFKQQVETAWQNYIEAIEETHRLDKCIDVVRDLVGYCDKLISDVELWKLVKEDKSAADPYFYNLCETLRHISWMIKPFMPETSEKLQTQLGVVGYEIEKTLDSAQEWGGLQLGTKVAKGDVLFMRKQ